MMPPPGCSPIAPSDSTRYCISDDSIFRSVVVIRLLQLHDARQPRSDLVALETLAAGLVETSTGQVVGKVALGPAPRVVLAKVVAVAIVPAVAQATHQMGGGI